MRPKTIAAVALLALATGLTACGGEDSEPGSASPPTTEGGTKDPAASPEGERRPATETIAVRGGEPVGGIAELEFDAGERVRFRVRSDVADEIHVHGYDVYEDVPAGRPVTVSFDADIEGIFEVELHDSGEVIAELRVNP